MKHYSTRRVIEVLRDELLLREVKNTASGHDRWEHSDGRFVRPVLRYKDVSHASLHSLGLALEAQGLIARREFLSLVRHG
jgi:hypothetical protein